VAALPQVGAGVLSLPAGVLDTDTGHGKVQGIQSGNLDEAPGSGPDPAAEAVRCASELLRDGQRVPADLALRFLPWLVAAAPQDALTVLQVCLAPTGSPRYSSCLDIFKQMRCIGNGNSITNTAADSP